MDYKEIKGLVVDNINDQACYGTLSTRSCLKINPLTLSVNAPAIKVLSKNARTISKGFEYSQFVPEATFVRHSSIANFFSTHLISVPRCLKTSPKKYLPSSQLPLLHLINMLMRAGNKERVFLVIWNLLLKLRAFNFTETGVFDCSQVFLDLLSPYEPIFAYKIQRVAKSTRKNSRGKSGKYLILWKYVPTYKRLQIVLRWLLTDIRLSKGRTFALRCDQAFTTLTHQPKTSTLHKLRKFNHIFVFKYFRKTLLTSLKTVRSQTAN